MRLGFIFSVCAWGALASQVSLAVDTESAMEVQDLSGTTAHFTGTVGTISVALPSSPGNIISEVVIKCPFQTPTTKQLQVSFDGGVTYFTLDPGEFIGWSVKGKRRQIHIKGAVVGVVYDVIMNREGY